MTQNDNSEKDKEKINPFVLAYFYSYTITVLVSILFIVFEDGSFSSDALSFAFSTPLILPIIPFFTFLINAMYLIPIVIYGIFLYYLFKLPYKFSNYKTLIFTLIILFTNFAGIFCIVLSLPYLVA